VAPDAGEGATLEEDDRADAGPVFAAIPLDVVDQALLCLRFHDYRRPWKGHLNRQDAKVAKPLKEKINQHESSIWAEPIFLGFYLGVLCALAVPTAFFQGDTYSPSASCRFLEMAPSL
jgi:hypothetical protein